MYIQLSTACAFTPSSWSCMLCIVYCTIVYCTIVYCTICSVQCTMYSVQCTLYIVHSTMYTLYISVHENITIGDITKCTPNNFDISVDVIL